MKFRIILPILFCVAISPVLHAETKQEIMLNDENQPHDASCKPAVSCQPKLLTKGNVKFTSHSSNLDVAVILTLGNGHPYDGSNKTDWEGCGVGDRYCYPVENMDISVNGKSVFVPRIIYWSMSNVRSDSQISIDNNKLTFIVKGGEGITGFIRKIEFDEKRILRQASYSPLKPDYLLQETIYYEPLTID